MQLQCNVLYLIQYFVVLSMKNILFNTFIIFLFLGQMTLLSTIKLLINFIFKFCLA